MNTKLFNRNFTLVVIGQIISLFGNTMLRFALPLYILNETGSAAIFGSILALAMIPTILLSPFGGILADRVNKKWIMVVLDFITASTIFIFFLTIENVDNILILISIVLVILSIIQSFYQPAVQSSIPLIVPRENILQGNATVSLINSLSNTVGPILGGVFFGFYGIIPLAIISACCFFIAAIMEIFIKMPHIRQERNDNIIKTIKSDLKLSISFITKENPVIFKILLLVSGINLVMSAMIIVGFPVFITIKLGLSAQMYGISEGILAAGAITGGLSVGLIAKRLPINQVYIVLVVASLGLIPLSIPFIFSIPVSISFIILTASGFFVMSCATIFSIRMMTLIQELTPAHLLAKVISYILTLCMCALPLGQIIYGFLYNSFLDQIYLIILAGASLSLLISLSAKKAFKGLKED